MKMRLLVAWLLACFLAGVATASYTHAAPPPSVCCGGGDLHSYGDPCNWWDAYWNTQFTAWNGTVLVCRYTGLSTSGYTLIH